MFKHLASWFDNFVFITTSVLLILGGIGIGSTFVLFVNISTCLIFLGVKLIVEGKLRFDKYLLLYFFFLMTLLLGYLVSKSSLNFFYLFLSGGLEWLLVLNFKEVFNKNFSKIIVIYGLLMGIMYFWTFFNDVQIENLTSLFYPATSNILHSNIGDLWAIVLIQFYFFTNSRNVIKMWLPICLGLFFLAVSYSRTAVLALFTGVIYIHIQKNKLKKIDVLWKNKIPIIMLSFAVVMIFLASGVGKSLLASRPYFLNSILNIPKHPVGVGMGNFGLIDTSTNYAHNIVLEVLSGIGYLSIVFLIWFFTILKKALADGPNTHIKATLLTTTVLFLFSPIYIIPGAIWLWFTAIGLSDY